MIKSVIQVKTSNLSSKTWAAASALKLLGCLLFLIRILEVIMLIEGRLISDNVYTEINKCGIIIALLSWMNN